MLFLSSLDSGRLRLTRKCVIDAHLSLKNGKQIALASVQPEIDGVDFGLPQGIDTVYLSCRHEGDTLFPIKVFPCFVHVAISVKQGVGASSSDIDPSTLVVVGWGELYGSEIDADSSKQE
jgi:hypothetical protein